MYGRLRHGLYIHCYIYLEPFESFNLIKIKLNKLRNKTKMKITFGYYVKNTGNFSRSKTILKNFSGEISEKTKSKCNSFETSPLEVLSQAWLLCQKSRKLFKSKNVLEKF